jgi:hypothetical protein
MASRTDFALYDRNGQLTAVVEVKNKLGTSREWAVKLRRNLLVHDDRYGTNFLLLVTPDRLYLWKNASAEPTLVQPTYEVDAKTIFAAYLERAGVPPDEVSGQAFELIVAAWLGDLMRSEEQHEESANGQEWLVESGLLAAIRDGRIEYEEAA